jgi:glycosyltransferase involved in cell wall biosynthesis
VREKAHYRNISSGKLRVLYVGSLSQRKGLAYLIEAAELLKNHLTLTIVGNRISESCAPLNAALRIHEWKPSLSNLAILDLMQTHDILAFPSLFEGFGLVISEAMSQGTPVITTERTAGRDIIKTGDNGWLIEAGVTSSLVGALERILSDYTTLRTVGESAMETARQRPWSIYGRELAESLLRNSA